MKIIDIYRDVINYAGMSADEYGYISFNLADLSAPTEIDGKRLTLPTRENLRAPEGKVFFHAFSENALHGESEVFRKYKQYLNTRINVSINYLIQGLLNIMLSNSIHAKLNPEQRELLKLKGEPDNKTLANYTSWSIKASGENPESAFCNIYIKRGGIYKGEKNGRVAIVNFTFYNQLKDGEITGFREKDKPILNKLMEFIFPEINEDEYYNSPSNSMSAPYMEALLTSSFKIVSRINEVISIYKDFIEDSEHVLFDTSWVDKFETIDSIKGLILEVPPQLGNEGTRSIIETKREEELSKMTPTQSAPQAPGTYQPTPTQQPTQSVVATPQVAPPAPQMPTPAPKQERSSNKVDFNTLMGIQSQPQHPQYPQQGQMPYPHPGQQYPTYPGQQPNIATQINNTPPSWLVEQDLRAREAAFAQQQQAMAAQQAMGYPPMYQQGQPPMQYPQPGYGYPQQQYPQPGYGYPAQQQVPSYPPGTMAAVASQPPTWL